MVQVPFGRQKLTGYVIRRTAESAYEKTKPILRLLDPIPAFDSTQLPFFEWIARYYLAGLGEVISTALPSRIKARTRRVHIPTDDGIEALATGDLEPEDPATLVLREVIARPGRTRKGIERSLADEAEPSDVGRAIDHLVRHQWVAVEEREQGTRAGRITTVKLLVASDSVPMDGGVRMRGVLARLAESDGQLDMSTLVRMEGAGARDAVRRLETKGLVAVADREDRGTAFSAELSDSGEAKTLNPEQQEALDRICSASKGTFLLHGVTGSGKTEVYLQASQEARCQGKQVLVLVPEIALTPQLVGRFRARFGDQIAVLHSGLTPADRLREWRRIRAGEAHIAIGARSALFAPFTRLGLIVVDEEHDGSYKQDDGVRYNARDLAVVRGAMAGCPVVLGSATPSVETWQNAQEGRYTRLTLPQRATSGTLPQVELLDMRGRPPGQPLTPELINMLRETVDAGEQAIVLYNRRGYAPVVECTGCGATYSCPSCGVGSLVLHQRQGRLRCHYCGFRRDYERD